MTAETNRLKEAAEKEKELKRKKALESAAKFFLSEQKMLIMDSFKDWKQAVHLAVQKRKMTAETNRLKEAAEKEKELKRKKALESAAKFFLSEQKMLIMDSCKDWKQAVHLAVQKRKL